MRSPTLFALRLGRLEQPNLGLIFDSQGNIVIMLIDPCKNLRAPRDMNARNAARRGRKNCEADFPGKAFELGQQWDRLCFRGARK